MNNTLRFNPDLRLDHKAGAAAILTGRHLKHITAVFRAVEFLLLLAVISRCSLMLPLVLRLSGDYFRDLAVTGVSPRFIFVIGNAIVIILFVKSGGRLSRPSPSPAPETETTTYIVSVYSSPSKAAARGNPPPAAAEVKIKCYRRSKSEKMHVRPAGERRPGGGAAALRRTKTEKMERRVDPTRRGDYPEDHMSSEEFRQKIENFIARQQRSLREEEEDESGTLAVAG